MSSYTIRFITINGEQNKMLIKSESYNRAKQKFETLYPNIKILGVSQS